MHRDKGALIIVTLAHWFPSLPQLHHYCADTTAEDAVTIGDLCMQQEAASIGSSNSDLPLERGLAHLRARRIDDAIAELTEALRRENGRLAVVRGLATAYLLNNQSESAQSVLANFTLDHPTSADGWRLASQLEWKLGNRQRSIEVLKRGLDHVPSSAILHRQMLVFLAASSQIEQALNHVETGCGDQSAAGHRVQEYLAAAVGAWKKPAALLAPVEEPETTDSDLLDSIALDSKLLEAILALPQTEQTRPVLLELEWKLAKFLESQPHHADRQVMLAKLQMGLGADSAAMLSLQRALRTNPNFVEAHRLRAQLHVKMGEIEGAIDILKGLLKRKLAWPDIHYQIAELEQKRGHLTEARSHLYQAIQLNPNFAQAQKLLSKCIAA